MHSHVRVSQGPETLSRTWRRGSLAWKLPRVRSSCRGAWPLAGRRLEGPKRPLHNMVYSYIVYIVVWYSSVYCGIAYYINMRILRIMTSGIPVILGLGTSM